MSEIMECAHCHKATTMRCSRCKLLLLCSRECLKAVWKTHKPDCTAIQRGRAASVNAGENPETLASIPLPMPMAEYAELCGPTNAVRERHAATEKRLDSGDASLPTADKVRFFADMLQVVDTSGNEHEHRSLVHKMALNRQYNNVYRDAVARLQSHELAQLNGEMQRRRIGAFFKQSGVKTKNL